MKKILFGIRNLRLLAISLTLIAGFTVSTVSFAKEKETSSKFSQLKISETLNPHGETAIKLPSALKDKKIEGVVFENKGKVVPVELSIKSNVLTVKTLSDLIPEATYDIKIFTGSGEYYIFSVQAEEKIQIIKNEENIIRICANPSEGFYYPYFLFIPKDAFGKKDKSYMVVEGNNSAYVSNSFGYHEEVAKGLVMTYRGPRYYAENLAVPLLVPIFPRLYDYMHEPYMQFLDRKALLTDYEEMKRVDLQLTAMIKHAQKLLKEYGIKVEDKVFLSGYSSSAKFAQRYAILQPHMVKALAVGGIAGTTTLPLESYKGVSLRYPVGIADFEELTGSKFNAKEYKKIAQYYYMGENDNNDATQWRDCYDEEDAQTIWKLFGTNQIKDNRLQKTISAMNEGGFSGSVQYHVYKNIGHEITGYTDDDVVEFFKANSANDFKKIKPHE